MPLAPVRAMVAAIAFLRTRRRRALLELLGDRERHDLRVELGDPAR
ncbi:MAG: hypothetical protein R3F20_09760 [Planctomycetota bacterium]